MRQMPGRMDLATAKSQLQKTAIERIRLTAALPFRRELAALHSLSEREFWEYQKERLARIYQDAVAHVPYYRDNPDIYPTRLVDASDPREMLQQLPVLKKSIVKAETDRFWRQPALIGTAQHTTGGTTGTPLRVRASVMERGFTQAILDDRYAHIAGTHSPRILRLNGYLTQGNGRDDIFRSVPGTKFAYLSIYALAETNRHAITAAFRSFRPQVIHGYASAIHQLALLFKESPLPDKVEPFIVVTTSETTMPHQRDDIESYLRTKVFDEYGSQEGQHFVIECEHGTKHIHPARGIVELLQLDSDDAAPPGATGRVVVTGLMNRTMPLIRYDLGDTAVSTGYSVGCQCGSEWPSIGTVYGRMEDLVVTRDGRRIPLLSHSTLKDIEGIRESQIIQTGYERFKYRIVPAEDGSLDRKELEDHVRKELTNRLQSEFTVAFEYPDRIERTSTGKLQAVKVEFHQD
jgi:phenylacetate-CoA ligase